MSALLLILFLFQPMYLVATQQLTGNNPGQGATFSFPINIFTQNRNGTAVYVGAGQQGGKEFAIAGVHYEKNKFLPLTPEKIVLDGVPESANPLHNQAIAMMVPLQLNRGQNDDALAVVKADEPNSLYVHQFLDTPCIITQKDVKDAAGNSANGIVAMTTNSDGKVFAAVKGHDQLTFGAGDSGIAVFTLYLKSEKEKKDAPAQEPAKKETKGKTKRSEEKKTQEEPKEAEKTKVRWDFMQHDVVPGPITPDEKDSNKSRAMWLTKDSSQIGITSALSALAITDMHWDNSLNVLYVSFNAQAGQNQNDGARSVATIQLTTDNKIVMSPIAADAVFAHDKNIIVGARGASACACVHAVRTMFTTTMLHYLIVHGDACDAQNSKRSVYALPILNMHKEDGTLSAEKLALHGTLAKIKKPCTKFRSAKSHLFLGRYFDDPAQKPEDVYTADSLAAKIGGGPLHADITQLMVKDDAVFALVKSDNAQESGIYYSQAIFEADGAIAAWTQWQKTPLSGTRCLHAAYEHALGTFIFLADTEDKNNIMRTSWTIEHTLSAPIQKHFIDAEREISGLFELSSSTGELLAITGTRTVLLSEGNNVTAFADATLVDLCTVTCAAVVTNQATERLVVGGLRGLAYLHDDNSDIKNVGTFHAAMQFKKFGDYSCVRKLVADEQYLYVLTDKYFDRIDCAQSDFESGTLVATRLFTCGFGVLSDALVSAHVALLATSTGLLRNECDVRLASCPEEVSWVPVHLEGNKFPILSLFPITLSGKAQDLARLPFAQVYVLTGYVGKSAASVYRLTIQGGIDVQVMQEWKNEATQGAYIRFGDYKEFFATDGTLYLNIRGKQNDKPALLINGVGKYRHQIAQKMDIVSAHAVLHSMQRGSWMIAGNFGLLINE